MGTDPIDLTPAGREDASNIVGSAQVDGHSEAAAGKEKNKNLADDTEFFDYFDNEGETIARETDNEADKSEVDFTSDAVEAIRSAHSVLHYPKRHDCEACNRAVTSMQSHVKRVLARDLKKFGQLVTIDHILCKNWLDHESVAGHSDSMTFFDFGTHEIWAQAVNSLDSHDTIEAIEQICGHDKIQMCFSGSHE